MGMLTKPHVLRPLDVLNSSFQDVRRSTSQRTTVSLNSHVKITPDLKPKTNLFQMVSVSNTNQITDHSLIGRDVKSHKKKRTQFFFSKVICLFEGTESNWFK